MPNTAVNAKRRSGRRRKPFSSAALVLAAEPVVAVKNSVPEHVRAALDLRLRVMVQHEPGTRTGDDPEDLHQMRVSVRRMRAVLRAARPMLDRAWADELRAELGWLGGVLGPVRDLDVLLDRLHGEAAAFPDNERDAADALMAGLAKERADARKKLLAALDSQRYATLVSTLVAATRSPLPAATSDNSSNNSDGATALLELVRQQHRKLAKAVRQAGEEPPNEELHALRIQDKRLRYAAELVEISRPEKRRRKQVRALLKAATRFQDLLGEHQDTCVAEHRVRQLLDQRGGAVDRDVMFVAGRLVEREQVRRAACRAQWLSVWHDLDVATKTAL